MKLNAATIKNIIKDFVCQLGEQVKEQGIPMSKAEVIRLAVEAAHEVHDEHQREYAKTLAMDQAEARKAFEKQDGYEHARRMK